MPLCIVLAGVKDGVRSRGYVAAAARISHELLGSRSTLTPELSAGRGPPSTRRWRARRTGVCPVIFGQGRGVGW